MAVEFSFNEVPKRFFLTKDFSVGGVGLDLAEKVAFVGFVEFVVQIHRYLSNEILKIKIFHDFVFCAREAFAVQSREICPGFKATGRFLRQLGSEYIAWVMGC